MTAIREDRRALFGKLKRPETQPEFWDRVATDVDWTVEGTHPLSGRYRGKKALLDATFGRLAGGVELEVENVFLDGDTTIAELVSTSRTNEGVELANRYCWICRFERNAIVEVRAYLDSAMVADTLQRNEAA
jgi:hypothetical protein